MYITSWNDVDDLSFFFFYLSPSALIDMSNSFDHSLWPSRLFIYHPSIFISNGLEHPRFKVVRESVVDSFSSNGRTRVEVLQFELKRKKSE